jgi:hypothetical protein
MIAFCFYLSRYGIGWDYNTSMASEWVLFEQSALVLVLVLVLVDAPWATQQPTRVRAQQTTLLALSAPLAQQTSPLELVR